MAVETVTCDGIDEDAVAVADGAGKVGWRPVQGSLAARALVSSRLAGQAGRLALLALQLRRSLLNEVTCLRAIDAPFEAGDVAKGSVACQAILGVSSFAGGTVGAAQGANGP